VSLKAGGTVDSCQ